MVSMMTHTAGAMRDLRATGNSGGREDRAGADLAVECVEAPALPPADVRGRGGPSRPRRVESGLWSLTSAARLVWFRLCPCII